MIDDDIPQIDVEIPEVTQIAFVVEDLEDGMDRFGGLLGVKPWEIYRFEPPRLTDRTYRGDSHEYSMALALTEVAGTMLELIEPLEGESIYTEHLEEHGEGLHHIACFAFDDLEAVIEEFERAGMGVLQSGTFGPADTDEGVEFFYFDTAAELNGVIFETARYLDELPAPDRTYP
jgi:methylmalonyl-CoA/ethylmalonyl-CoA epimerase